MQQKMVQLLYFFRPPADYSGDVSLDIVAVVQEPNGSTATSDLSTLDFSLTAVSEEASASSNDVSVVEYTMTLQVDDETNESDTSSL